MDALAQALMNDVVDGSESDCLVKTRHCDGVEKVVTQCDFCPVR